MRERSYVDCRINAFPNHTRAEQPPTSFILSNLVVAQMSSESPASAMARSSSLARSMQAHRLRVPQIPKLNVPIKDIAITAYETE